MAALVTAALEFIDAHATFSDKPTLISEFSKLLGKFGFQFFIMTGLPAVGDDVEQLIVANAWPEAWTNRYRDQRYFLDDPVTQWSISKSHAFTWATSRASVEVTPKSLQIAGEAKEFGLVDGIGCPTPVRPTHHAVVSLASDQKVDLPLSLISTLQMAASLVHHSLSAAAPLPTRSANQLTQRERDILRWSALGRTRADIATILGISEGTVKTHQSNILLKLDALNSTHAVVIAMITDQIRV